MIERIKNRLEVEKSKLIDKQGEQKVILHEISEIQKEITKLEWRIEELEPTIKMQVWKKYIDDGYYWVKIENENKSIEVTRKNAVEVINELQNIIDEIENIPLHKARTFAEHNDNMIPEISRDIASIKKKFGLTD